MQFTTYIFATFTLISAALATPVGDLVERDLAWCGAQQYDTTKYTCYPNDNYLLCPIDNGAVLLPCGEACYNSNAYVCVDGHLCPVAFPKRCGKACYNSNQYHCVNGILVQN